MSYAHFDDEHDNGQLTRFRQRLSGEIRMQTGDEFRIFQDRNEIQWGDNWATRVDRGLDAATFLLAIITPSFFKSGYCLDELMRFRSREKTLNRQDLIVPIYYVTSAILEDPHKRSHHIEARIIASRQYADWRDLRFKSFDSPIVRKGIEQLALRISAALPERHR